MIGSARMARLDVAAAYDLQSSAFDQGEQFSESAQAQMFGQVGQNQPGFAAGLQVCSQSPPRNPRNMRLSGSYTACSSGKLARPQRPAEGCRRSAARAPAGISRRRQYPRACPVPGVRCFLAHRPARSAPDRCHYAFDAAPGQQCRQHAGAGADIECQRTCNPGGSDVSATRSTYSPRTGENTP